MCLDSWHHPMSSQDFLLLWTSSGGHVVWRVYIHNEIFSACICLGQWQKAQASQLIVSLQVLCTDLGWMTSFYNKWCLLYLFSPFHLADQWFSSSHGLPELWRHNVITYRHCIYVSTVTNTGREQKTTIPHIHIMYTIIVTFSNIPCWSLIKHTVLHINNGQISCES